MMHKPIAFLLTYSMSCTGLSCDPPSGGGSPPKNWLIAEGTYETSGIWNLGAMFTERPTIGAIIADDLIERTIDLAGVPSLLHDQARDVLAASLGDTIRGAIDARMPPELSPDSPLMADLAAMMGSLEVDTTLVLTASGADRDELAGEEEIIAMRTERGGVSYEANLTALTQQGVGLAADVTGDTVERARAIIEPHEFAFRLDGLVTMLAADVLGVDLDMLTQTARDALGCPSLVSIITGGATSYEFSVAGQTFSIGTSLLAEGCTQVESAVFGKLLGFLRRGTGVTVGGDVSFTDLDADRIVDQISGTEFYHGTIASLPGPFTPTFPIQFTSSLAE